MLGVEDYGSGSESEDNSQQSQVPPPKQTNLPSKRSSSLVLPPPGTTAAGKAKRKVAIGLPALKPTEDEEEIDEKPAAKKPKLSSGAGVSSLLSMLPAPKQKTVTLPAPERVLGAGKGPGLVFNSRPSAAAAAPKDVDEAEIEETNVGEPEEENHVPKASNASTAMPFLPPSLKKGKANISLEEGRPRAPPRTAVKAAPAVDFFSLGSSSTPATAASTSKSSSVSFSAAPEVPTFEIPEPSISDEYPGYYQLPSGQWVAHDPQYYEKFRKKWEADYNAHVRALEKGSARGFEGYDRGDVEEVDAAAEMERAKLEVKELEERKAVSKIAQGEPDKPKMTLNASKMSGVARSRHQLATMLNEAYTNREALEEKIAQGRRNRKEAGNKYGF
ncbi:hypothetical protein V5O48_000284 [Marasmius crinis-equi]|uniref:Mitotic checkpoint regulator, MAD2B-interacting-domain-containing protein n=1 Tax=Marasmius crinis-equi TaxID=585013 RepID=A0ABR3G1G9_9AGAR